MYTCIRNWHNFKVRILQLHIVCDVMFYSIATFTEKVRRDTKLRENNLRVTQKYYEIYTVNSDKATDYSVLLDRQPHKSNIKVCAALK